MQGNWRGVLGVVIAAAGLIAVPASAATSESAPPETEFSVIESLYEDYLCEELVNYYARGTDLDLVLVRLDVAQQGDEVTATLQFENGMLEPVCGSIELRFVAGALIVNDWLAYAEGVHQVARQAVLAYTLTNQPDPATATALARAALAFPLGMFVDVGAELHVETADAATVTAGNEQAGSAYSLLSDSLP